MKRKAKFNILLVGRRKFEWNFDWTPIYDVLEEMHTDDYEEVLDWVDELRMYPLKRFVFDFFDEKTGYKACFREDGIELYEGCRYDADKNTVIE